MIAKKDSSRLSIRLHLLFGAIIAAFLVGGLARWAWTTELAGAVVANGTVVVDSNVKQIQHPTGGVVGAINVRDDDYVKAGDVLIHLDDTQTKANAGVFSRSLDELTARQARLEAEKDAADAIDFPEDLIAREPTDSRSPTFSLASASCSASGSRRARGRKRSSASARPSLPRRSKASSSRSTPSRRRSL